LNKAKQRILGYSRGVILLAPGTDSGTRNHGLKSHGNRSKVICPRSRVRRRLVTNVELVCLQTEYCSRLPKHRWTLNNILIYWRVICKVKLIWHGFYNKGLFILTEIVAWYCNTEKKRHYCPHKSVYMTFFRFRIESTLWHEFIQGFFPFNLVNMTGTSMMHSTILYRLITTWFVLIYKNAKIIMSFAKLRRGQKLNLFRWILTFQFNRNLLMIMVVYITSSAPLSTLFWAMGNDTFKAVWVIILNFVPGYTDHAENGTNC
jgi:hypothetical protein